MKILYVTQIVPYPPHGGVLQRGFNLLKELGRDHVVHLLAFHHPDELPTGAPTEESRRVLSGFCGAVEYFDLPAKRSSVRMALTLGAAAFHREPFSVLAHRSAALRHRMAALCGTGTVFDLVHLDTIALAPYARYCGTLPVVLAHHNVESQLMERRAEREHGKLRTLYVGIQARRLRLLEQRVAGTFDANIVVSGDDAMTLKRICPSAATVVIPNGVDTDYFQPTTSSEDSTIVFTGGMGMFANRDAVHWFIDSTWPLVKAQQPNVRFLAIGKKASTYALECARRDPAIEVPGFVPDIRPRVAQAAVYVVPMRVGGGTRLKVLDAMAQGKALVSTSLGAEGIEARHGEHLLIADDPQTFADYVVRLLRDRDERRRLGTAARALVEQRYSWQAIGTGLIAAYEDTIRRP